MDSWNIIMEKEYCNGIFTLLNKVLKLLDGKATIINDLRVQYGLAAKFTVTIFMNETDGPEIVLYKNMISFADSISAEIEFDFHCHKFEEE